MNATPAEVIAKLLIDGGIGTKPEVPDNPATEWPVTYHNMPDELPNDRITVFNTGFMTEGVDMGSGLGVRKPTIQVRIRAMNDAKAWVKGRQIETLLEQVDITSVTVTTQEPDEAWIIQSVLLTIPLIHIGQEEVGRRQIYTINAKVSFRD